MTQTRPLDDAGENLDWAGLEDRIDLEGYIDASAARSLIGYFRDCAVATQRGKPP
jgi:hypothetical protein